ncbi:MAG: Adenine deaminase [Verrucomicrobia subdivision 3 bacterium]|nr:Adenine deaminase [Limisphaerales bacterium]MCS1416479.1 Adenine deaminase [Limisphaerales bacterium]
MALNQKASPRRTRAETFPQIMNSGSPTLFVSLGTAPAIVPEAFLLPDVEFGAVRVLTTEQPEVAMIQLFFRQHYPKTNLAVSRVAGFKDLSTEADHHHFEEVLYRWLLKSGTGPEDRYICLSGGFKTMSVAMQRAAVFLGAKEVFHVLADNCCEDSEGKAVPPSTIEQIFDARAQGCLHWIRLGAEAGWPQLREASPERFPLLTVRTENSVEWLRSPNTGFRKWQEEIIKHSRRIARAWDRLSSLPFTELAAWPSADLNWLNGVLDAESTSDREWVRALPKIELHCHLGGFATMGEPLDEVRSAACDPSGIPPICDIQMPEGWPLPNVPIGLERYRGLGDNSGSRLLRDKGCLRRQCQSLYRHLCEQNIVYAEIRCSPANYADRDRGRSPWDVLSEIRAVFQSCMDEESQRENSNGRSPFCHVNLLISGTRQSSGDYRSGIARHLSLAVTAAEHWTDEASCRVVGVDLAGYEDPKTRAHYFQEEFTIVHRCGLALTVHAGENDDAEGIWRAVFDLAARRLGHALKLFESEETMHSVVNRGIGVEMCPYANLQIREKYPLDDATRRASRKGRYPLCGYLRKGVRVTVNTDNIGISGADLSENLLLASRLCPDLTRLDVLRLQRNALDAAFLSPVFREEILKRRSFAIPRP